MNEKKLRNASYVVFVLMIMVGIVESVWIPKELIAVHYTGNVADSFVNQWSYILMFPVIALGIHAVFMRVLKCNPHRLLFQWQRYMFYLFIPLGSFAIYIFLLWQ